jgi:hypothetical protein
MQPIQEKAHGSDIKRVNRGYKLREDLITRCKYVALNQHRKLYEIMEDALTEYLERHQLSENVKESNHASADIS